MTDLLIVEDLRPYAPTRRLVLDVELLEEPEPMPRAESRIIDSKRTGKRFVSEYTPPKARQTQWRLSQAIKAAVGPMFVKEMGALAITVEVLRAMPSGIAKKRRTTALPTQKPDGDNYLKLILDSARSVLWKDDAQCVDLHVTKRYAVNECGEDIAPRWRLKVEALD